MSDLDPRCLLVQVAVYVRRLRCETARCSEVLRRVHADRCYSPCSFLRVCLLECLLRLLRVLLNLTHDHELGSHRVGEEPSLLQTLLSCTFKVTALNHSLFISLSHSTAASSDSW